MPERKPLFKLRSEKIFLECTPVKNHLGKVYKHRFTFRFHLKFKMGERVCIINNFKEEVKPIITGRGNTYITKKGVQLINYEAELVIKRQRFVVKTLDSKIHQLTRLLKAKGEIHDTESI